MVAVFIRRILNLFTTYVVRYEGLGVSNNAFYAGGNSANAWRVRSGIKSKYSKIFGWLVKPAPRLTTIGVVVFFNSRHDVDNISGTLKIFLDQLRESGKIENDTKRYVKFTCNVYDPQLALNTFEFVIVKIK